MKTIHCYTCNFMSISAAKSRQAKATVEAITKSAINQNIFLLISVNLLSPCNHY